MSTAAETGDVTSVSDAGNESTSSRSNSHHDTDAGEIEGSESEPYIEVEHLGEDSVPGPANFATAHPVTSPSPPSCVVRHITKRTLITIQQRSILEDFYRNGMSSASLQLTEMHEAAAEKTGLDVSVVRNWIRNRRRPNAAKIAEKMAEKIAAYASTTSSLTTSQVPTLIPSTLTPLTTLPHTVVVTATNHHPMAPGLIHVGETAQSGSNVPQPLQYNTASHGLNPPEPKRLCQQDQHSQNSHPHQMNPSSPHSSRQPLVVKVRVCGSGECDFVEVEVPVVSYQALLVACCEELEVGVADVAKIRKLPNILIRKDRDVQRMKEGQELEVVIKDSAALKSDSSLSTVSPPATYPMTSMLTVNPFSSSAMLTLPNHNVLQQRGESLLMKSDENGTGTLPIVSSDSPSQQLTELHNHSSAVNGLQ